MVDGDRNPTAGDVRRKCINIGTEAGNGVEMYREY